jgi:mannose-1-phosphate guanylyltransferase
MNPMYRKILQDRQLWMPSYKNALDKIYLSKNNLWGLVLAGGEGKRLLPFITDLYGVERPKQFCSIVGGRQMLHHTLDRVKLIIPQENILTVINRNHIKYINEHRYYQNTGSILVQPVSRETANGILLSLLHIYFRDPNAHVAIFPSDHFILGEENFMKHVETAFRFTQQHLEKVVLLGSKPTEVENGYGWIESGGNISNINGMNIQCVNRFWEKPDQLKAQELYNNKCLLNTFVMVGKIKIFLSLFRKAIPDTYKLLSGIMWTGEPYREVRLNDIYTSLPPVNFSKSILELFPDQFCTIELSKSYWSDWGDENRVMADIKRLNLSANRI